MMGWGGGGAEKDAAVRGNILLFLERQLIHVFDSDSQTHYRNNIDYCL